MPTSNRRLSQLILFSSVLILVNLLIVHKLFVVDFSAYQESNEGSFIAIAKQLSTHFSSISWWPYWACGIPFQNTYLPLSHAVVALHSYIFAVPPALAFHQVEAICFILSPLSVFFLALQLTNKPVSSLSAALAFSVLSPLAWVLPKVAADMGGALNLRRLHIIGYYGEGPYTMSLVFIPLAILLLFRLEVEESALVRTGAALFAGLALLSNAFSVVIIFTASLALILTAAKERRTRYSFNMLVVGAGAYLWISPFIPPSVVRAILLNAPTVDGDYRFTGHSLEGVLICGSLLAVFLSLSSRLPRNLKFICSWAIILNSIVILGVIGHLYVVPQPHRYEIAAEMSLCLCLVLMTAHFIQLRFPAAQCATFTGVFVALMSCACLYNVRYAEGLIKKCTDIRQTAPFRLADFVEKNMGGQRVMISGSYSFHFNDFTDTPQLHGAQDTMLPNPVLRHAVFAIYSGMNTGASDFEVSTTWLRALGAHAISVPGPRSAEYYKPFANPEKFRGKLPELWHEGDDTLYLVPSRTGSVAHVVPQTSIIQQTPINGLDIGEVRKYVSALEDPALADADARWLDSKTLIINAKVGSGEVVSVQVTSNPGWIAKVSGTPVTLHKDGIGFMYLKPIAPGLIHIDLEYSGSPETDLMFVASLAVSLFSAFFCLRQYKVRRGRAKVGS